MYIDIHCHLTGGEYEEIGGVDGVLARARENGVGRIVCSGFDLTSSYIAAEIAARHDDVYFTAGFHPSELHKYQDGDLEKLRALCADQKCIAVGEIGLDYHFDDNPAPEMQRELFIRQMTLADEVGLPVVLHSRDAAQETLQILTENKELLKKGGLMHCYSYSPEMVADFAALGLYFSFGGPSTFKNAKKVQECVQRVPCNRILSETDCPYLTPVPFRGTFPNEPKNVKHIVENMAILRNENEKELQKQILDNAKTLFFRLK
ncbi:MAG: TatD family hydrolase [Clostridia bacterium]|nr:TatD family hydrolase [Clostridia bacterium]MBQ8446518.1 TatD family hydrolase [Clostridia bacterium]